MITTEQLAKFIPIDETDELIEENLSRAVATAHYTLLGSIGEDVEELLPGDPRVTELELRYAADAYHERSASLKAAAAESRLVNAMENQLRFELRRKRQEAATS